MRIHPGPPLSWKSKRTSVPPPVGSRTELQPQLVVHDHGLPPFGSQALQRCSGLLNRGARGSTVATHQFQKRKLNRTSAPGVFRKQIVPLRGMGSMPSDFRLFDSGLAEQLMHSPCKRDQTGAAPVAGSLSNGGRDVTASIRSCEDRRAGAAPVGLPISKSARCRNRRGGGLQTRSYPVQVRARAPFRGHRPTAGRRNGIA